MSPKVCQQPRLLAVVGGPNGAAEQDRSAVPLDRAEHLPCMPRKRRPVESDEHQTSFRGGDQQGGIVEAEPCPGLPPGDVNNRKFVEHTPAGRETCSRQPVTDAVSVSPPRALLISSGKALAYASARLASTRGHRKCLAVSSTSLVSSCTARTSHTATRCPVRYASRPDSESRKEIPGNSVSRLFSMTYRATRLLFDVLAARACLITNRW